MSLVKSFKRSRLFYGFINLAFNSYDSDRVKAVGADTAAAEWLVKNDGWIRAKGRSSWVKDYNSLSSCYGPSFKLAGIEAVNIDITSGGCQHFNGLKHVRHVCVSGCVNIDDKGLQIVSRNCWETLEHLDVSGTSVSIRGLEELVILRSLKTLKYDKKLKSDNAKHEAVMKQLIESNKELEIEAV